MKKPLIFALLFSIALVIQVIRLFFYTYTLGADTACATAKECPPDFKAKWVEAGCVCVPTATARR